ncbi:hypothetical protein [Chryseobacterium sp. 2R14A]|uniref:hypothetical protein n=1 Tax=Chryseobacterium sp. 2R14A TaxID=3380353 RepID=UPI003CEA2A3E
MKNQYHSIQFVRSLQYITNQKFIMQFIDFKKEHFSHDEKTKKYFLEISKEEVGYGELSVKQKKQDETLTDTEYAIEDSGEVVKIIVKSPIDIRVNF